MFLVFGLVSALGCQTSSMTRVLEKDSPVRFAQELDEEVSLKSDRESFEKLRKDVPQGQKVSNDEMAMDLEMMVQAERPAHEIRGAFQLKVRKLRQKFRDKSSKIRKKFRDTQKKQRDDFLNVLKQEREEFRDEPANKERTKGFYAQQDLVRKDFFTVQKEQRKEFEGEMRQKSKDFHGNMRERIKQFNEQLRLYTTRQKEKEREEKKKKKEAAKAAIGKPSGAVFKKNQRLDSETQKILKEFDDMKSMPAEKLGQ